MVETLSDIELGNIIQNFAMLASMMDLTRLKEFREEFQNQISNYEAIGIVDGHFYFIHLQTIKARFQRLDALINFIEVSKETKSATAQG
jgi:hypothetical protein